MKNFRIKTLASLVLFLAIIIFSGCSTDIKTEFKADKDFKGTRVMSIEESKDDLDKNFKGGVKKIDAILAKSLPKELTFKKAAKDNKISYTFTLTFSSLDDYRKKVDALIGKNKDKDKGEHVNYKKSKSYFASGVEFTEDFSSADLMGWFDKIANNEKLFKDGEKTAFRAGKVEAHIEGNKTDHHGKIRINNIQKADIEGLDIDTVSTGKGYERTIVYTIDGEIYKKDKKEIDKYMDSLAPDSKGAWTDDKEVAANKNRGKIYTLKFKAKDEPELLKKTMKALDTQDLKKNFIKIGNKDKKESLETVVRSHFSENIDVSAFINSYNKNVNYTFKSTGGYKISERGEVKDVYEEKNSGSKVAANIGMKANVDLKEIKYETSVKGPDKFKREVTLELTEGSNVDLIKKYFETYKKSGLKVKASKNKIELEIEGDAKKVTNLREIFGPGNSIKYTIEKEGLFSREIVFQEKMNSGRITNVFDYNQQAKYELDLGAKIDTKDAITAIFIKDNVSGSKYKGDIPVVPLRLKATQTKATGYIIIALVLAAIGVGVFFLVKMMKKKKAASPQNVAGGYQQNQAQGSVPEYLQGGAAEVKPQGNVPEYMQGGATTEPKAQGNVPEYLQGGATESKAQGNVPEYLQGGATESKADATVEKVETEVEDDKEEDVKIDTQEDKSINDDK